MIEREQIIRMARQVGYPIQHEEWRKATEEFATLVAAAEREACAKVCEAKAKRYDERAAQNAEVRDIDPDVASHAAQACEHAAAAIRARGQA